MYGMLAAHEIVQSTIIGVPNPIVEYQRFLLVT
jgi:hypothetical protein